ncbi:MAG: flagellar hook assembly protein FlgD [Deltaproteobacteria bacterium]|nr:flagellar hook assembly protein FlgD [Deltaproteobacteria bacterium]
MATPEPSESGVGKDQFLKLLVAQLGHQDPLQPTDAKDLLTQLVQFASVEQSMATNQALEEIRVAQTAMANAQLTEMVGREVFVRSNSFEPDRAELSFLLDRDVASATLEVVDAEGRIVRTIEAGPRPRGRVSVLFDGKDQQGRALPDGEYELRISARDEGGSPVEATPGLFGVVDAVSFAGGSPELLVNGSRVRPADVLEIGSKITPTTPEFTKIAWQDLIEDWRRP